MAAYGSSASAANTNSDSLVITKPTSLAAGDLMVAFLLSRSGNAWNTPSGWTAKGSGTISNNHFNGFAKVADAGDAAASNFTFDGASASAETVGWIIRVTGTFTSAVNIIATASTTDATADAGDIFVFSTSLTPVADSFLIIGCGSEATDASATTSATATIATDDPTFTSRIFQAQPTGDDVVCVGLTASRTQSTAIGNTTVDFNSTGNLSNGGVIVFEIHDTASVSISPTVISLVSSIPAPSVSASATVSPAVITAIASVQAPTVTTSLPKWVNPDKSNTSPTITNPDKTV